MRVKEETAERLVTQDDAIGWGTGFLVLAAALAAMAVALGPALSGAGPQIALGSSAIGSALIGLRLARRVTGSFDKRRGVLAISERGLFVNRLQEARLDEVQEVLVERSRGGRAGPSHRASIRVRGELWPLAATFRDRRSATRVARAVSTFLGAG